MLDPMCCAAAKFNREFGTRAVVAGIRNRFSYDSVLARYANDAITVSYDDSRRTVFESDLVVTASGTATLETAIIGRPMVVVYRTGTITYHIARRLIRIDTIGLVNLVLGEKVVPELIQHQVTPDHILSELRRYREDSTYLKQVKHSLDQAAERLSAPTGSKRAAELIAPYL